MIELPSIRIRLSPGRIRVLRLASDGRHIHPARYIARVGPGTCRACGCTDHWGCIGGCGWVNATRDLCSRCFERMLT